MDKKKFIVYVRKFSVFATNEEHSEVYAYIVETEDILHVLGEIYYRSLEHIYYMNFVSYSEDKIKYVKENGIECINYNCKYPIGIIRIRR